CSSSSAKAWKPIARIMVTTVPVTISARVAAMAILPADVHRQPAGRSSACCDARQSVRTLGRWRTARFRVCACPRIAFALRKGEAMRRAMRCSRLLCFAAIVVSAGCSHDLHTADFIAAGPYGNSVHTFTFVDTSRATPPNGDYAGAPTRTLPVDV